MAVKNQTESWATGLRRIALGCAVAVGASGAAVAEPVDYMKDVWPIFLSRCIECHGAESQKGDLRLDSPEAVQTGGEFGAIIKAGEPDNSSIIELISLPEGDADIMPAKGDPLSEEEIATIRRWVEEGATFEGWDPANAGLPEEKAPLLVDILSEGVDPAPQDAIDAVAATGALVMPLGMNTNLLRVNFQLLGDAVTDEHLALLQPLASHITWLNLAGTAVTDAGLAQLAPLSKLTMLHLERTGVTDAGLAHLKGLENLQYLNLYNTQVSDAGLDNLKGLERLEKLYLWQSQVTPAGADTIKAALPAVEVNLGTELEPPKEEETASEETDQQAKHTTDGGADSAPIVLSTAKTVRFNRDVRPVLSQNCFFCHGFDKNTRKAGLRLDERESATEERDGIIAIVPGNSAASEVVKRLRHHDSDKRMPPVDSEREVTEEQIELIARWIDEGAEYEPHWAYIPPTRPNAPELEDATLVRNPIDRFIQARLAEKGWTPSPEADKVTQIRRLSFDLTGLPPTAAEVDAYVNDNAPDAYENLVDRLMASPHFGERMAVNWLDQVRYADTNGYHRDQERSTWPYRDYVIDAFNTNKPFDQFTIEQLAGDQLPDASRDQLIASGYNRLNQITSEGGAQDKEYLAKYMSDRVRNVSSVWLGATVGCAECHDHKFDPFTTENFYSLGAFFADIKEEGRYTFSGFDPYIYLPTDEEQAKLDELESTIAVLKKTLNTTTESLAFAQMAWEERTRIALEQYDTWQVVSPIDASAASGATLSLEEDGTVVASDDKVQGDSYTVTLPVHGDTLTGIRIESVPHSAVGGMAAHGNGNFILTGVGAALVRDDGIQWLSFSEAVADFEQAGYPASHVVDTNSKTGWAIEGHKQEPHRREIALRFAEPVSTEGATALRLVLKHERDSDYHTMASFRVATTGVETPTVHNGGLEENVLEALMTPVADRRERHTERLARYYRSIAPALEPARVKLKKTEYAHSRLRNEIPTTLVTKTVEPRTVRVLPRGNWMDESGPVVEPVTPEFLPPLETDRERANRLDLAKWLVSDEHPLTSRVYVNRLWDQFFGTGLSKVLDDLGSQGEWPTHPELLDWLAVEFRDSGWDMKHMVRTIVTSHTYRQSSLPRPELKDKDPYNRFLARQSRFRLPAEFVRDTALKVSGLLNDQVGGKYVRPYQPEGYYADTYAGVGKTFQYVQNHGEDLYRRGMYTFWKRAFLHPSLLAFDAPTREECTADRTISNTPLQALVLLNDPIFVEAARVFAERIVREGGAHDDARIRFAFRTIVSREPSEKEYKVVSGLLAKHRTQYTADVDSAKALIETGEYRTPDDIVAAELAAWTSVARTLFNLHETIYRS